MRRKAQYAHTPYSMPPIFGLVDKSPQALPPGQSPVKPTRHQRLQSPVFTQTYPGAHVNGSLAHEPAVVDSPAAAQVVVLGEEKRHVVAAPQSLEGLSGSQPSMQTFMPGTSLVTDPSTYCTARHCAVALQSVVAPQKGMHTS